MSKFGNSRWEDSKFSQEYREKADDYIPERDILIEIVKSFYKHFLSKNRHNRVLDLGCGDGLIIQSLLDVVLPPTKTLERWYLSQWKEWIDTNVSEDKKSEVLPIPQKYKDNPDNTPDTLSSQLESLKKIGFIDVDCYYKYGIFAIFGGRKV